MLGNTKGRLINKYVPDYVLFDLETTGTSSNYDEVIEISAVKVQSGVIVDEFSQLVNPGKSIPYAASMVNHITDDMVAEAPEFEEILQAFMDFVGDSILVGHNINSFDMKFLYRDSERYFGQTVTNDYIDTLKLARLCLPDLGHHRLSDLAQYYGISTEGAHRALNDCCMNQQVFEQLAKEMDGSAGEKAKVKPRSLNCTSLESNRCVPTIISTWPFRRSSMERFCSAALRKRHSRSTRTGKSFMRCEKVL